MRGLNLSIAAGVFALAGMTTGASAAVIIASEDSTTLPATAFVTVPNSTTGPFTLAAVGTIEGVQRSPWGDLDPRPYSVLSPGGTGPSSATYNQGAGTLTFSFLWGSPDSYNVVEFWSGVGATGALLGSFTGSSLTPPPPLGSGFDFVTFLSDTAIGSVRLVDLGPAAFEFANVSQTPLPAALPLFVAGLGAFGVAGLRRKRKASVTAAA